MWAENRKCSHTSVIYVIFSCSVLVDNTKISSKAQKHRVTICHQNAECQRHAVYGLSICESVWVCILKVCREIYNFAAVWNREKLIRCRSRKVKNQGHTRFYTNATAETHRPSVRPSSSGISPLKSFWKLVNHCLNLRSHINLGSRIGLMIFTC